MDELNKKEQEEAITQGVYTYIKNHFMNNCSNPIEDGANGAVFQFINSSMIERGVENAISCIIAHDPSILNITASLIVEANKHNKEKIVLEYSKKQGFFHIQSLQKAIERNFNDIIIKNKDNDYMIIGIFATMEEALEEEKKLNKKVNEK